MSFAPAESLINILDNDFVFEAHDSNAEETPALFSTPPRLQVVPQKTSLLNFSMKPFMTFGSVNNVMNTSDNDTIILGSDCTTKQYGDLSKYEENNTEFYECGILFVNNNGQ
jgi:hypothetical protein